MKRTQLNGAFMLKSLIAFTLLLFSVSFTGNVQAASDVFTCKCVAKGPGVDSNSGEKICSYSCNCNGFNKNEAPKLNIAVSADRVATSARSRDTWDMGSSICHGQYAYKSNLSDPNWKIKVKFSPFTITSYNSNVSYDEADQSVEVAIGVRYYLKRTPTAPEIFESLRNQL